MNENRATRMLRQAAVGAAAVAVLMTATACGDAKEVKFTNAGASGAASTVASAGSGGASSGDSQGAASSAVATPPNIEITRQNGQVCVRDKTSGSQACAGEHGTVALNGVVVVDGKLVSTSGSGGSGGSVSVNGGGAVAIAGAGGANAVAGAGGSPVPTSGQVSLSGAVRWSGTASGTCQRSGDVRHVQATFGDGGRLEINAVGTGVVEIQLSSGGNAYAGNWVGDTGIVTLGNKSLKVTGARVGRGTSTVQLTASFDC